MLEQCSDCKYFQMGDEGQYEQYDGLCKRFPPKTDDFVLTFSDDWCGEFNRKIRGRLDGR